MSAKNLERLIKRLAQGSFDSVQTGNGLSDIDIYLDVDRSIEKKLYIKMDQIKAENGGIIFVVGSAGDGKSHLISKVKQSGNYSDFLFYNDATASCSPRKTAIETLETALVDFSDGQIDSTNKKLIIAINLGKLSNFINDDNIKSKYNNIIQVCKHVFDNEHSIEDFEVNKIKILLLPEYQIYEFHPELENKYPVTSEFCSTILERIITKSNANPFYNAYQIDKLDKENDKDPLILNYELLMIESIRDSIIKYIIEAIIRCQLRISPREYFDFVSNILLPYNRSNYHEKDDFFDSLLPNLVFHNGNNNIQKALHQIEPIKECNQEHDKLLSLLFTSTSIKENDFENDFWAKIPIYLKERTNKFYENNGIDLEKTSLFIFNIYHLSNYHSENNIYIKYLSILRGIFNNDGNVYEDIFDEVKQSLPRHYGIYINDDSIIPLPIQGRKYKLFSKLNLIGKDINFCFDNNDKNNFQPDFCLMWQCNSNSNNTEPLYINFSTYSYIYSLNQGQLALNFNNNRNLELSKFIRSISKYSEKDDRIYILSPNEDEIILKKSYGGIKLS